MGKKVAIIQSNYIPWKGYFDIINSVDEFILLDDVQYTRRDWRNRNLIKTPQGKQWLTVPVEVKNNFTIPINQVSVSGKDWRKKHWNTIVANYSKAPFFRSYKDVFESLYMGSQETMLSQINYLFLTNICNLLNIKTKITWSTDYELCNDKNERLAKLCQQANATEYLSGPAAKAYLDEGIFSKAGISVLWMDYSGYPEYNQPYPPFDHGVSIVDLLFSTGEDSRKYMISNAT